MSEQHIPEPWQFGATPIGAKEEAISLFKQSLDAHEGSIGEYFYEIYDDEARRIAFLIGPSALANSSRILACVNACAGLPGKALKEVLPNYAAYNALHKQRDELLAALEDAVSVAKTAHEHWDKDQDSKVGKYLIALSGRLIGYDGRTDAVHKAITSVKGGA